jgi:hypothetical protein
MWLRGPRRIISYVPPVRFADVTSPAAHQPDAGLSSIHCLVVTGSILLTLAVLLCPDGAPSGQPATCARAFLWLASLDAAQLVFTQNRNKHWRCLICPDSKYTVLSQAVVHEDRTSHVAYVRSLDREPAAMSSPLRATRPANSDSESSSRSSPTPSSSPPSRDPVDDSFDLFGGIPSAFLPGGLPSVHGPALASDDPNQIYDDFSGELAHNRPSPQSPHSDGDDEYYSDDSLVDDDTLEPPESDGLFGQYDDQFASEQRRKFLHSTSHNGALNSVCRAGPAQLADSHRCR